MTIDKQALRQIAESVDREEWDVLDNGDADYQVIVSGSLERGATYRSYQPVTNEISNKKIAAFIAAFNPKVALALLDELEHYKSREERVTKLVLDNSTSWDVLYEKLEAAERRMAEQRAIVAAAEKLVRCKGRYHSELNYRALAKLFGVITPDLPPLVHENVHYAEAVEVEISALRQRIQELEARVIVLPQRLSPEGYHIDEAYMVDDTEGEYLDRDAVIDAIRAAGIKVKES
ncbi:ead/Ea22-like family protein [Salmonella enterica]|nr:ead/Ea22-like family protein [Salmonella enterica]EGA4600235.1 ead/Ea22-like family protein [Salmonella enterica]EGA4665250.1 ead/Ea22-like family protein [Salmonella enterica]EIS4532964.1 ead/Ea22-like family protein [Salmonella enterica]MLW69652.1 ead/Ea22-like family protein [Salmonella enterica]